MDTSSRKELGIFLRNMRQRRAPADVGLPVGPRRKTPGLRREEVAGSAGVGATWYTWLEQGRPINVSLRTLQAISDALVLSRSERDHMFRLAGLQAPAVGARGDVDTPQVPDAVYALIEQVNPFAGCVYTLSYDLLVCNDAYAACFPDLAGATGADRNILWYFSRLDDAELATHEQLLHALIGRFRLDFSENLDNPRWRSLVDDVILRHPRMKEIWDGYVVNDVPAESVDTVRTAVGPITFTSVALAMPASPGLHVLVGVPRTDQDRELLDKLVALTAGQADARR